MILSVVNSGSAWDKFRLLVHEQITTLYSLNIYCILKCGQPHLTLIRLPQELIKHIASCLDYWA
jgi:hypothetical protein